MSVPTEFSRNLGFMTKAEQNKLCESTVAIAGAGGDGGIIAIQLARLGVGALRLADPEIFEPENVNRQATASSKTVGLNKAETVGEYISDLRSGIDVEVYDEGVTNSNIDQFIQGADLLVDETDFTLHAIGVGLARKAREAGIPNLMAMNIGFGATVTTFHPEGRTFDSMLGIDESMSLQEVAEQEVPISKWLPYIPPYGDIEVFKKVASGQKPAPSIAPGVSLAASIGATQGFLNLVQELGNNRPKPVYAPKILAMDSMTGESRLIRHPGLSFKLHIGKMYLRNLLKINPVAEY